MNTTSERDAFLRAIADSPDDDAPRLVFADWLDENGDAARAEFIRVQCAADVLPENHPQRDRLLHRSGELFREHRDRWNADIAVVSREARYRRGFIDSIAISHTGWERFLPVLAAIRPHVRIEVRNIGTQDAALATPPELADVRRLQIRSGDTAPDNALAVLLRSPHLHRLNEVDTRFLPNNTSHALAAWPGLAHVRTLGVFSVGLRAVLSSPHIARLRSLDLFDGGGFSPDAMPSLIDWPGLEHLEQFTMHSVGDADLRALADSGRAIRLRRLHVLSDHISATGCLDVLASPGLPTLRDVEFGPSVDDESIGLRTAPDGFGDGETLERLYLWGCPLGNAGVAKLARLPRLAGVSVLRLSGCGFGPSGARALADSPGLRSLKSLEVGYNPLGPAGVQALAESPHLSELEYLGFNDVEPGTKGPRALTRSPWVRSLRELDFSNNRLTPTGTRQLARVPFDRLETLTLTGSELDWSALAEAGWLSRLRVLKARHNRTLDDAGLTALAGSLGPSLHTLNLGCGVFGEAGLRALLARPLTGLRVLDLWANTRIDLACLRVLADWPGLALLISLSISTGEVDPAGVEALTASPYLTSNLEITLGATTADQRSLSALRERVRRVIVW